MDGCCNRGSTTESAYHGLDRVRTEPVTMSLPLSRLATAKLRSMIVVIESLASGGEGVAHLDDGRVVFVQGACPGDRVHIEVLSERKRWVQARIASIVEPSADRVEPPCPYFGSCGGCQWQHVEYTAQLLAKRRIVADALQHIGDLPAANVVEECMPSPKVYGYRNKIELVPAPGRRLELGFHRLGSDEVLPIERCLLLPARYENAPARLAGALRYASGTQDLGIGRVGLRVAANTSDVEVALWTAPSAFPRATVASTLSTSVKASSVVRVLAKDRERHTSPSVEVLSGRGYWREKLGDHTFAVSAPSFFQVNTGAADALVSYARGAIAAKDSDAVLDLYAGVGTFTLSLAEEAGVVVSVEGAGSAVRDLRRNLDNARLGADVEPGDAARVLPDLGQFDAVLVDPPRIGLDSSMIAGLVGTRAVRIVYVSCDPATLARDAKALAGAGYGLVSAVPVDLFPQTYHVETVATFEPSA